MATHYSSYYTNRRARVRDYTRAYVRISSENIFLTNLERLVRDNDVEFRHSK